MVQALTELRSSPFPAWLVPIAGIGAFVFPLIGAALALSAGFMWFRADGDERRLYRVALIVLVAAVVLKIAPSAFVSFETVSQCSPEVIGC